MEKGGRGATALRTIAFFCSSLPSYVRTASSVWVLGWDVFRAVLNQQVVGS